MVHLKVPRLLWTEIHSDLARPFNTCAERVGFLFCRPGPFYGAGIIDTLLAVEYVPVADEDYLPNKWGATLTGKALDLALERGLQGDFSIFHVHSHGGRGRPAFSVIDVQELPKIVGYFCGALPGRLHGALLLSNSSAIADVWSSPWDEEPSAVSKVSVVGYPMEIYQ